MRADGTGERRLTDFTAIDKTHSASPPTRSSRRTDPELFLQGTTYKDVPWVMMPSTGSIQMPRSRRIPRIVVNFHRFYDMRGFAFNLARHPMDLQRQGMDRDKGRKQPSPCAVAGIWSHSTFSCRPRMDRAGICAEGVFKNLPGEADPRRSEEDLGLQVPRLRSVGGPDRGSAGIPPGTASDRNHASAGQRFRSFWWDIGWGAQIQPDSGARSTLGTSMTACATCRPPANRSGIDVPQEALLETIGLLSFPPGRW